MEINHYFSKEEFWTFVGNLNKLLPEKFKGWKRVIFVPF